MGFMYSWHSSWTYFLMSLHQILYPSTYLLELNFSIELNWTVTWKWAISQRVNRCITLWMWHTHGHTHMHAHVHHTHTHITHTHTHAHTHRSWQWNWNLHHWRSRLHFPEPEVRCSLCLRPISGVTITLHFYLYINPEDTVSCLHHKWAIILSDNIDRDISCGQCDYHRNVFNWNTGILLRVPTTVLCNTGFWPRVPTTILWNL